MIDKEGVCSFDIQGLEQVIKDVKTLYNGEEKVYITGLEAGAHLVWATAFLHPQWLYGAAPVSGNYIGRCIIENKEAMGQDRSLPIHSFYGSKDDIWKLFEVQDQKVRSLAIRNGFNSVSISSIDGKGHERIENEILGYFNELYKERLNKH
ncbi:MAG TPA: hypothetical protein VGO09_03925 [Flavisolibacter sp.]|nr:hypothetical protein [Flavisolibacter sp.]